MTHIEQPIDSARFDDEWLEADGFGGFASGTVGTARTRRYHALLLDASRAPGGRVVLVNSVEAWLEANGARYPLTMQRYVPDVLYPDIRARLLAFDTEPWPSWRWWLGTFGVVIAEVFVVKATGETVLRWRIEAADKSGRIGEAADEKHGIAEPTEDSRQIAEPDNDSGQITNPSARLYVRPLLSGRDYHALHHQNAAFDFSATVEGERIRWQPSHDLPAICLATNGVYHPAPDWYRNFCYDRERERGLDFTEDLATPGVLTFELARGVATMIFSADRGDRAVSAGAPSAPSVLEHAAVLERAERARRQRFASRLARSADAYIIARAAGRTIIAGFPWFTDWGRDTFISMRGLLLTTGRFEDARAILVEWAGTLSEGMLPNRFPDYGAAPEYNAVDASLWFAVAVHDYLATGHADAATRAQLQQAVDAILAGYTRGTRFGIRADDDGLLRAGTPGVQLTWMDAKVGDWVVTPRIGKPVEVQALWINALRIASVWNPQWHDAVLRATRAFAERFTDPVSGALFDVVDADHVAGGIDRSLRPNQIFAVGGLPFQVTEGEAALAVLAQVEAHLLTPLGLRTLAPADPAYRGRYAGGPLERDGAYHQGTVWPWLLGPFVEAWLRVHRPDAAGRAQARARFLAPLDAHLERAGLDHLSEVADGDPPHAPGGTPFQAWSLAERMRVERLLAGD